MWRPEASRTASLAASSRVGTTAISAAPSGRFKEAPKKFTTTGLPVPAARFNTSSATEAAGGLEISTITSVPGSAASASSAVSIETAPTSSYRS